MDQTRLKNILEREAIKVKEPHRPEPAAPWAAELLGGRVFGVLTPYGSFFGTYLEIYTTHLRLVKRVDTSKGSRECPVIIEWADFGPCAVRTGLKQPIFTF